MGFWLICPSIEPKPLTGWGLMGWFVAVEAGVLGLAVAALKLAEPEPLLAVSSVSILPFDVELL
ncbi:MAG: hypothetical protein EBQ73_07160 [Gammaproteobacteria bacterium]|nr:hypothetical protein [Gammaproteobacteria bacterium]